MVLLVGGEPAAIGQAVELLGEAAAAITSPFFPASRITCPRRRTSSALASAGVRQTFVPISTMDWCSSGLISPSTM